MVKKIRELQYIYLKQEAKNKILGLTTFQNGGLWGGRWADGTKSESSAKSWCAPYKPIFGRNKAM